MDAETLRTILEAQTKGQQQMYTELMKRMEKMASASHPAVPKAPVATAEFVTNSLSTRLPEFVYDPENGYTFEVWYNHYENVISKDGATLDDTAKARLIVSKLDAVTYARFTKNILPKRACDFPFKKRKKKGIIGRGKENNRKRLAKDRRREAEDRKHLGCIEGNGEQVR